MRSLSFSRLALTTVLSISALAITASSANARGGVVASVTVEPQSCIKLSRERATVVRGNVRKYVMAYNSSYSPSYHRTRSTIEISANQSREALMGTGNYVVLARRVCLNFAYQLHKDMQHWNLVLANNITTINMPLLFCVDGDPSAQRYIYDCDLAPFVSAPPSF